MHKCKHKWELRETNRVKNEVLMLFVCKHCSEVYQLKKTQQKGI